MKKIILLAIITVTLSCESRPNKFESTTVSKLHQQADIDSVKSIISNSFQDIWSDLDHTKISKYHTKDFVLLENGAIWNNDSIQNYTVKEKLSKPTYVRINRFDFVKSEHKQNSIWIAYHNYAAFVKGKDTLAKAHWLESVVAVKENNKWKLQLLHSTPVRK